MFSEKIEWEETEDGTFLMKIPILSKHLPRYYCFASGRHSGSFYLKIGAAAFCLGHLVHSGLLIGKEVFEKVAAMHVLTI